MRLRRAVVATGAVSLVALAAPGFVTGVRTPQLAATHSSVSVPLEYEEARVYVPVTVGHGPPRWFILDTGAQGTLLDSRVADSAGIATSMSSSTTGAGGRRTPIGYASGLTLSIGPIPLGPLRAAVAPLDSVLGASTGRAIPGIIGSRFFHEHVVELDFATHMMRVADPATFEYRGNGLVIPLDLENDIPYADGWITSADGTRVRARFLIDLGAKANMLVTEHFAAQHALAQHAPASVTTEFGAGMGGETSYQFIRVAALALAANARTRVDSLVIGLSAGGTLTSTGYDALLGAEYLSRFNVILDYPRERMILEPRSSIASSELDMSGMFLVAPDPAHRRIVVKSVRARSPAEVAGLRAGDVLVREDELEGRALTLAAARQRLRSRAGRVVLVTVHRDGAERTFRVALHRVI